MSLIGRKMVFYTDEKRKEIFDLKISLGKARREDFSEMVYSRSNIRPICITEKILRHNIDMYVIQKFPLQCGCDV